MNTQNASGLLELITAAVTPVVMVSVAAVLILGINSKHQSIADRIRNLTAEARKPDTSEARLSAIAQQMVLFKRRVFYTALAQRLLYLAAAVFLCVVLLIVAAHRVIAWSSAAFVLFLAGVALMLVAVVFEFRELHIAGRTLDMEMSGVLAANRFSRAAEKAPVMRD